MSPTNDPRPSKAERTAQAREKARLIREAQLKKEKRNSWLIRGGVLLAAVAIVVIIAIVVLQTNKNNEPVASTGPVAANMNSYGGVTVGKKDAVIPPTTTAKTVDINSVGALPTAKPDKATGLDEIGIKATAKGQPVQTVIYLDFMCPVCNNFEKTYGDALNSLREEGKITVEYRPLGFLDTLSSGTNYSSRAGAAAACVADQSPGSYKKFLDTLYANQPAENSKGLDNATLVKYATESGAADISNCVNNKTYRPAMAYTTALATAHGITGTPTVFMDGKQWQTGTFDDFYKAALAAK
ncbi:disulfide bond formation protein DsbA (plasmid) [Arthrobacter sp. ERGS1:01]|uniref:DsbA family protein n=1 Tax=Arthrobacter sp. ERGS1:01 TaxID=1704044 RepID=UPI0006B5D904|nr:thioredoxin domain-containing protein [Arthrobacter sp. ERGS1:01]ALE04589.1 disulfide bond formation protein DsbA [Arthrobacter sp. ERGS1:01]